MNTRNVGEMKLNLVVTLGTADTTIADVFKFEPGQVVELRQLTTEPVELRIDGGRLIAVGEMAVVGPHRAIKLTRVLPVEQRLGWRRYE